MDSALPSRPARLLLVGLNGAVVRSLVRCLEADRRIVLAGAVPDLALGLLLLPVARADLVLVEWSALGERPDQSVRLLRAGRPGLCIGGVAERDGGYTRAAAEVGLEFLVARDRLHDELPFLLEELAGYPREPRA